MTESETSLSNSTTDAYLSLKLGKAVKTGSRSQGYIHYRILSDPAQQHLYMTIVGNDGGGCYSKEIVPFDKVEQCLQGIEAGKPIASKLFQPAFIGRSANNAGFLAAILRAEQLLAPAPDAMHQHSVKPDWLAWKTAVLAMATTAEHYQPEPPKPRINQKTANPTDEDNPSNPEDSTIRQAGTENPAVEDAPDINKSTAVDDAELNDEEMELLQRSALGTDISSQQDDDAIEPAQVLDKQQSKKQRNEKRLHPTGQENSHDCAS